MFSKRGLLFTVLGVVLCVVLLLGQTAIVGSRDLARMAVPSNPAAGYLRLFANDTTGYLDCVDSAGGDCLGIATAMTMASALTTINSVPKAAAGSGRAFVESGVTIDANDKGTFPGGIEAGDGTVVGEVGMPELLTNGSEYVSWLAPNALTNTLRLRFPNAQPTTGQMMTFGAPASGISDITFSDPPSGSGVPLLNTKRWLYAAAQGVSGGAYNAIGVSIGTAGTAAGGVVTATDSNYSSYTTAATTDSDGGVYTGTTVFWPGTNEIFQSRGRLVQVGTAVRFWTGLWRSPPYGNDTTIYSSVAAFRYSTSASDTYFMCVTCDGAGSGSCTVNSSAVTADTAAHKFEVYQSGSNYIFKIDGSQVCSHSTNLPSTNDYGGGMIVRTLENASKAIRWYGFYGEADR